ncbi:MAG: hypothetical protein QNK04_07710 [Myxococcota bacterium]|nr:hypothetical protein [Myxococcota bacterium]
MRSDVPLSLLAEMVSGAYTEILLTWLIDPDYRLEDHLHRAAHFLGAALAPAPQDPPRPRSSRTRRHSA